MLEWDHTAQFRAFLGFFPDNVGSWRKRRVRLEIFKVPCKDPVFIPTPLLDFSFSFPSLSQGAHFCLLYKPKCLSRQGQLLLDSQGQKSAAPHSHPGPGPRTLLPPTSSSFAFSSSGSCPSFQDIVPN